MSILSWFALGLAAGLISGRALGGGWGVGGNVVVGVLGAIIAGLGGSAMLGWPVTIFNVGSAMLAILGAAIMIALLRSIPERHPLE